MGKDLEDWLLKRLTFLEKTLVLSWQKIIHQVSWERVSREKEAIDKYGMLRNKEDKIVFMMGKILTQWVK